MQGIAGGIAWVAALSLIAAATGIEKRGQMMGIAMSTVTLGVLVGLAVPTVSAVSLVVTIVVMPMGFASGAMMPLEILPSWVQTLSHVLPLTYLLDALRWSLTGVAELSDALLGCGITAAAGAVLFLTATRLMRWK